MTTTSTPKKPVFRKQLPNGISAAVFENTRDGRTYRSINLQRSYKHDGSWKRMSIYLDHEHIPFMIDALETTWKYLNGMIGVEHPDTPSDQEVIEHLEDAETSPETELDPA